MRLPYWLLRLLPMWDYICPKCKREVSKKARKCRYCGERFPFPLRVPPKVLKDEMTLSDYVHKHVFPRIAVWQREYLAQFFTEIFSDGFESGDYSAWTGTVVDTGQTLQVSTTQKHHGTYGSETIYDATQTGGLAYCYKDGLGTYSSWYDRFYLYIDSHTVTPTYCTLFFVWFYRGAGWGFLGLGINAQDSTRKLKTYGHDDGFTSFGKTSATGLALDTWYCLEIQYNKGSPATIRFYLDGSELTDLAETTLNVNFNPADIEHGATRNTDAGETSGGLTFYQDCVVVADTYIGEEAAILKEVTDSFGLTDAVTRPKREFGVSDSFGLSDVIGRPKRSLGVADSFGLSEVVTRPERFLGVLDSFGLTDSPYRDRLAIPIQDSLGITDLITRPKREFSIFDSLGLSDIIDAWTLIEAPKLIVTQNGHAILRISKGTRKPPEYILLW